jgi:Domain of unknown function (DUF1996)
MARGERRLSAPVRLVAVATMLLATGGVVAAIDTSEVDPGGTDSAAAGCRPDSVIALNATLAQSQVQRKADRKLIGQSVASFVRGQDRVSGSDGAQGGRMSCTSDAQPVFHRNKDPDGKDPGGMESGAVVFPGRVKAGGPFPRDFIPVELIAPNVRQVALGSAGSAGSFTSSCGTNVEGHRNSDNFMVVPGKVNGAQHIHDYVGNLSTDAFSIDESLAAAGTTCTNGDKSTYFWPVLRSTGVQGIDANADGGGRDGNVGEILRPAKVQLQFRGNPTAQVTAMPDNLAIMTGDATAATNGGVHAHAAWTCTGFEDRTTTKYPLCPQGSQLVRILDFPSCWDGKNLDSANHRTHVLFPQQNGSCSAGRVTLPQLRITLTFDRPVGMGFAVDAFPDQQHKPVTDHADFMNLMPPAVMAQAVDCINTGRT